MLGALIGIILGIGLFFGGATLCYFVNGWFFIMFIIGFIIFIASIEELRNPIMNNSSTEFSNASRGNRIATHLVFIVLTYSIALLLSGFIAVGLSIIFDYILFIQVFILILIEGFAMFIYDAFLFTILNNMPFLKTRDFKLIVILPLTIITITGIVVSYFFFPFEKFSGVEMDIDIDKMSLMIKKIVTSITAFVVPYVTLMISYLRHKITCNKCQNSGVCLMIRKDKYRSEVFFSSYTYTSKEKIGEVRTVGTGEVVADVYGDVSHTETDETEDRHYTANYVCKCCGNSFNKNYDISQITLIRKLYDKIRGAEKKE